MKIALLGVLKGQRDTLSKYWDFDYELVDLDDPLPASGKHEIDVLLSPILTAADAARVNFRLLQSTAVGMDKIDFGQVPPTAYVCNMYGHEGPIAEYCMAAMLDHAISWRPLIASFSSANWSANYFGRPRHGELAGRTVGIVGFGHIGRELAKRATAFGMRIIAIASAERPASDGADWIKGPEALNELMAASDYVIVSAALTDATRGMVDAAAIAAMKPGSVIVNVARGAVIAEAPLYEALKEKRIAGAYLDAWYNYPRDKTDVVAPSDLPFDSLDNATLTPHSSAWTHDLAQRRYSAVAVNIKNLRDGKPLMNVVQAPTA